MEVWVPVEGTHLLLSNLGNLKTNRGRMVSLQEGRKWRDSVNNKWLNRSKLMNQYFPDEWRKELDEWRKELQEGEIEKPIEGFDGYHITSKGRVYSTFSNKWLKQHKFLPNRYYWGVRLYNPETNTYYNTNIHTLVGRHFLNWEEGLLVLHKEETLPYPEINFVDNLWLGTYQDNSDDMIRKGRNRRN